MEQTSIKNHETSRSGGLLDGSWTHFGPVWTLGLIFDTFLVSLEGVLWRKSGQHGPNLDPKMEAKSMKNEVENQSNFQCLLESIFYAMLVDFWWKNGGKLAPTWIQNRCAMRKAMLWKNIVFPLGKTILLNVLEVKVGTKNNEKSI